MITINSNSGMAGRFMCEMHTVDENGMELPNSRRVVAPWQDNLITDSGLDNLAGTWWMSECQIGSGNSPPSVSDVALQAPLATQSGSVVAGPNNAAEGWNSVVGTYVFGQGVGTGVISELAVRPSSGSNITTRALIKDSDGEPTTIAKGPMDVLTVTYQIREYPDQTDTVTVVENPHTSVQYNVVSRALYGTHYLRLNAWNRRGAFSTGGNANTGLHVDNSALTPWNSAYTALTGTAKHATLASYVPGTYRLDGTFTFTESDGNVSGGISRILIGAASTSHQNGDQGFFMQASFDPPIDKDNTKTLIITLRKSWGRHTP